MDCIFSLSDVDKEIELCLLIIGRDDVINYPRAFQTGPRSYKSIFGIYLRLYHFPFYLFLFPI